MHTINTAQPKTQYDKLRAIQLKEREIYYVPNRQFHHPTAKDRLLGPLPPGDTSKRIKAPKDLPAELAILYDKPLYTREQEKHQFLKYNFAKFLANKERVLLDTRRPSIRLMGKIDKYLAIAQETKTHILESNLRLVVSTIKPFVRDDASFEELVNHGNTSLLRAIEGFDVGRGFKLSTYATWAIRQNLFKQTSEIRRHNNRFHTDAEESLTRLLARSVDIGGVARINEYRDMIDRALEALSERERVIIEYRWGLNGCDEHTLLETGKVFGVTRERVRQIQLVAFGKMAAVLQTMYKPEEEDDER